MIPSPNSRRIFGPAGISAAPSSPARPAAVASPNGTAPGGREFARESDLLAALLDHVTDRIYFKDRDSRFISISRSLAQDFGVKDPAEAVGKTDFDFFTEEHARAAFEDEQAIIRTGRPVVGKMEAESWRDGKTTWGLTTKVPLRNGAGEIIGTCGITKDVTALRETENELGRARDAALAVGRAKSEFLANMSHELRTPLNAILGLSEALLEQIGGSLNPRQVKSVTTISTSGAHLLALINDILDLSKIEAGRLELRVEPVVLDEFCESCLSFVSTQALQKQIGITLERDPGLATIQADPRRLKQILVNLLTNAVKFTPDGGRIGLVVAAPAGGEVVRFTVWDTGIGISAQDSARLFSAFTQIDSGLSRAQEGTGLGLALVTRLAELHGGSVTLESTAGKGSRFTVTLPVLAAPAVTAPPPGVADGRIRTCRRALIVEDDPTAGELLVQFLTELGLTSVVHGRGDEAVAVALRERPDVILLDIMLPVESGWTVLTRLKEHPGTRDIPVVIVSVVDEPGKSRVLGAAAHLTKPVTRKQLANFFGPPVTRNVAPDAPVADSSPATGPLILLAEDNEANTQTIGGYLESKGYRMEYAVNGLLAVQRVREIRPALVLMDIQMPVMDGLTAIRELRSDAGLRHMPIVALTALAMAGDRERCLAAGAVDYLSKPVSLKALAELVDRLLSATASPAGSLTRS